MHAPLAALRDLIMQLTLIPEGVVRRVATLDLAFDAVSDAMRSVASDEANILPVIFADGGHPGASFGVKSATHLAAGLLGLKVGSYFPHNRARGVPSHGSTTLLLDGETGLPRALVSAGYLNGLRTAAANAVAVEHLSRPDACVLGVLGAGHQAEFEIRAVCARRPIQTIRIWSRSEPSAQTLCEKLADLGIPAVAVPQRREAVTGSHIITTVTPAREALVCADWVDPGTHISAMGTDMQGKQELDPQLASGAALFADLPSQSARIGEFQHPVAASLISERDITAIGDVLLGRHSGRQDETQVTIFDSSGIAPQDLHAAAAVVRAANARGLAETLDF